LDYFKENIPFAAEENLVMEAQAMAQWLLLTIVWNKQTAEIAFLRNN
jgi:hypothetical protein